MLGEGFAVEPSDDQIISPISGKIVSIFPTKHAIGIKSDNGVEVLVHVGLNTVELDGNYFEQMKNEGDSIRVGDPLIKFNRKEIEKMGYDTTVVVAVTNYATLENPRVEFNNVGMVIVNEG